MAVKYRGWILPVQQVKELEQDVYLDSFCNVETFRKTRVESYVRGCGKPVPSGGKVDAVEIAVTVRITIRSIELAKVKAALCTKDAAYLEFPGQVNKAIDLKDLVKRKVGWTFVEIGTIYESSGLRDKVAVPADE